MIVAAPHSVRWWSPLSNFCSSTRQYRMRHPFIPVRFGFPGAAFIFFVNLLECGLRLPKN
jgi:hypothetical protein